MKQTDRHIYKFKAVTVDTLGQTLVPKQLKSECFQVTDNINIEMVKIPMGQAFLGSPEGEIGHLEHETQHKIEIESAFHMSKYPITQRQLRAIAQLPKHNHSLSIPQEFEGANHPVDTISWYEAVEFCQRLSRYTKREYRLPSEAEWEYACRAGTTTPFHFGETITTDLANYHGKDQESKPSRRGKKIYFYPGNYSQGPHGLARRRTTPVGQFPANAFGLHDMHGNVWEWCSTSREQASWEPLKGGSWKTPPMGCRSAFSLTLNPGNRSTGNGFRIVLEN